MLRKFLAILFCFISSCRSTHTVELNVKPYGKIREFSVEESSAFGPGYSVELKGSWLIHEMLDGSEVVKKRRIRFDEQAMREFIMIVHEVNVSNWLKNHDIKDLNVIQSAWADWEFVLKVGDQSFKSGGAGAYPSDSNLRVATPDKSRRFELLEEALERLLNTDDLYQS